MNYESFSEKDTFKIGQELGKQVKKGQIYCLAGDLGTGKTVFAKGFAEGLGVKEPISSPTFTILQQYDEGVVPFYHFDVYRIEDIEEMYEIGFDEFLFGEGVCLIEWAERVHELLPEERINIHIKKDLERGFDYRQITVERWEK